MPVNPIDPQQVTQLYWVLNDTIERLHEAGETNLDIPKEIINSLTEEHI